MTDKDAKPFDKEIWEHACDLSIDYHFIIKDNERLGYVASGLEFPHTFADGKSKASAEDHWRLALKITIATMLEMGSKLPEPKDPHSKYKIRKAVAGMELFTRDFVNYYLHNTSGSGNIWSTQSVRTLKTLHEKLGEFIEEVENK